MEKFPYYNKDILTKLKTGIVVGVRVTVPCIASTKSAVALATSRSSRFRDTENNAEANFSLQQRRELSTITSDSTRSSASLSASRSYSRDDA